MNAFNLGRGIGSLMICSQRSSSTCASSRNLSRIARRSASVSFGSALMISDALTAPSIIWSRPFVSADLGKRALIQDHGTTGQRDNGLMKRREQKAESRSRKSFAHATGVGDQRSGVGGQKSDHRQRPRITFWDAEVRGCNWRGWPRLALTRSG